MAFLLTRYKDVARFFISLACGPPAAYHVLGQLNRDEAAGNRT
jgi:hypothetical protein